MQTFYTDQLVFAKVANTTSQVIFFPRISKPKSVPYFMISLISFSIGFDGRGFEDSFNNVLTLDSSSDKGTLTTTQQTTTTGSLSSLSVPSSSSSSSLDQPDANTLL